MTYVIVGAGSESEWLRANLRHAVLTGVLHGEELARAFADFDVFAFPSRTETFGQVVQEALSSEVPVVVTNAGGSQFLVEHGATGFIAGSDQEFVDHVIRLKQQPELRSQMGAEGRRRLYMKCWDRVFVEVYKAYQLCKVDRRFHPAPNRARKSLPQPANS